MNSIRAIPELGQVVKVRSHQYVVTDIRKSAIPANPIVRGTERPENLVTLSSVEDDALGEELQVIWELEPEAVIRERMELPQPTAFDEPAKLDAFLDAVRWGAASTADIRTLQSPFRSGIDIEDYQLDPVVRAIQMPRVNLLHTGLDDFHRAAQAGLCAALVAHLGGEFVFAGEIAHDAGFPDGLGERLLAVDVLAHAHCHDARHAMDVVRSRDRHRVDLLVHFLEHDAEILEFRRGGKVRGHLVERAVIHIAQGNDIQPAGRVFLPVTAALAAHADAAEADPAVEVLATHDGGAGKQCGTKADTGLTNE